MTAGHKLEWSGRALADLNRLDEFLFVKSPRSADAAVRAILDAADDLRALPSIGRPLSDDAPEYRELLIPFADSGYILLYRVVDTIIEVQAVRHMREAGY